jgi:hypothetical protein
VNQVSALQGVPRVFCLQQAQGHPPQLTIHTRGQLPQSFLVTFRPSAKKLGSVNVD